MKDIFIIHADKISLFNFVKLIILAFLLYVLIYIFKNYIFYLIIQSPVKRKSLYPKIPAFELVAWLMYFIYSFYIIIFPFPLIGLVIFLLVLYFGKNKISNIIQGVLLRVNNTLALNKKILIENQVYTIVKLNLFDAFLENKNGTSQTFTYQELSNLPIEQKEFSANFFSDKMIIKSKNNLSKNKIKKYILSLPYSSTSYPPSIEIKQNGEEYIYEILLYSIDKKYFSAIKNNIINLIN